MEQFALLGIAGLGAYVAVIAFGALAAKNPFTGLAFAILCGALVFFVTRT